MVEARTMATLAAIAPSIQVVATQKRTWAKLEWTMSTLLSTRCARRSLLSTARYPRTSPALRPNVTTLLTSSRHRTTFSRWRRLAETSSSSKARSTTHRPRTHASSPQRDGCSTTRRTRTWCLQHLTSTRLTSSKWNTFTIWWTRIPTTS